MGMGQWSKRTVAMLAVAHFAPAATTEQVAILMARRHVEESVCSTFRLLQIFCNDRKNHRTGQSDCRLFFPVVAILLQRPEKTMALTIKTAVRGSAVLFK